MQEKLHLVGLDWLFFILLVVGGLNWGLVGLFDLNLVTAIFGEDTTLTNIVYVVVGISALYMLVRSFTGFGGAGDERRID
jgi:uncharacterized protein